MKTHLLVTALILASFGSQPAQSDPGERSAPAKASERGANPVPDGDNNVSLPPGTLRSTVDYIERKLMPYWHDYIGTMPNILLNEDAAERELPGPLTLHRASPLQAVALAAAAADCSMEAIFGPPETADGANAPSIIGYRITRNQAPKAGSGNVSISTASGPAASGQPAKSTDGADRQVVRVYAVGPILPARSSEEIKQGQTEASYTRDEKALLDLVNDAVEKAELNSPPPQFRMHAESRALIVKATAAQQEIVEQAIKALKENKELEARSAAAGKP